MSGAFRLYFTSNQSTTAANLLLAEPFEELARLGTRLRKAMGEKEILDRDRQRGGEFRPPTYRSSVESLDRSCWTVYSANGQKWTIVPYSHHHENWRESPERHQAGFMASAMCPYEYAYEMWDDVGHTLHPDLFDDATFGAWLGLLPQPASVLFEPYSFEPALRFSDPPPAGRCTITWARFEPRVHRSAEMGRYQVKDRVMVAADTSWRLARAEAYVRAWETMAEMEPADRYESVIAAEQKILDKRWGAQP